MPSETMSTVIEFLRYQLLPGRKYLYSWLFPFIFLPIIITFPSGSSEDQLKLEDRINETYVAVEIISKSKAAGCAYVLLLMSSYWLLEAVPMAITALLPVVCFPLLGIMSTGDICMEYMRDTVMIFLASLVAAAAVEESNLHQRIALRVLRLFGTSPQWLLLGFMCNTMFLSMWISNTAATALMIPIVDAVLMQINSHDDDENYSHESVDTNANIELGTLATGDSDSRRRMSFRRVSISRRRTSLVRPEFQDIEYDPQFNRMRRAIYLGVCYAANIGGTGTLTGTGTNLILYGFVSKDPSLSLSFGSWMFFAVPGMLVNVALAWLFIMTFFLRKSMSEVKERNKSHPGTASRVNEMIRTKSQQLGDMTFHEHAVLWLFILLIGLWFTRNPEYMSGWAKLFTPEGKLPDNFIKDSCPAVLIVILYFVIPKEPKEMSTSPPLMNWKTTQEKVAWNVILLLGGGFALSAGAKLSGLSTLLGFYLKGFVSGAPLLGIQLVTCIISLILTEVASNATTATILLGVVQNVANTTGIHPLSVMVPLALSCSYAFMLPVASPTNAIIFEAGDMKVKDMAIPGIVMKILCLIVTMVFCSLWGPQTLWTE